MGDLKNTVKLTFLKRRTLNAAYSQNAFARDLGVSSAALCQYLSGKRNLSAKNARRVVASLGLPQEILRKTESPYASLEVEKFALISDWHHLALLNLVEVDHIKSAAAAATRLGISREAAAEAAERLIRLGLMRKARDGWRRTVKSLDVGSGAPSAAIRKHNREKIELALECLDKAPLPLRDVSSLTLRFDPEKMPLIRKEIEKFQDRVEALCGSGRPREVYSLNVQFFPLSKRKRGNSE